MASEVKEDQKPEINNEAAEDVDEVAKENVEKVDEVSLDNTDEKEDKPEEKTESKPKSDTIKDKNDVKDSKEKKEPDSESKKKTKSKEESSDDDEEEETLGLLDRPVEVSGARARKKVERLEIGFTPSKDKEKHEVPEGKGKKLGECPRIEFQIQKTNHQELKLLHRILFNRIGSTNEIKKNIRKFSGFPFEKDSADFNRKKASIEKLAMKVLKEACLVLDIERSGTKEEVVNRIMSFLMNPEDSGKKVPTKKKSSKDKSSKDKKKTGGKKSKTPKKSKTEIEESEEEDDKEEEDDDASGGDSSMGGSDEEMEVSDKAEASSDEEPKKKKKAPAKTKPKASKAKKDEKATKGQKRKHESDEDAEDKPVKKAKMPTDEEISKLVKDILEKADLQEITMKKVIKQVSDTYPDFDLSDKKSFIKATIKSVIT